MQFVFKNLILLKIHYYPKHLSNKKIIRIRNKNKLGLNQSKNRKVLDIDFKGRKIETVVYCIRAYERNLCIWIL